MNTVIKEKKTKVVTGRKANGQFMRKADVLDAGVKYVYTHTPQTNTAYKVAPYCMSTYQAKHLLVLLGNEWPYRFISQAKRNITKVEASKLIKMLEAGVIVKFDKIEK